MNKKIIITNKKEQLFMLDKEVFSLLFDNTIVRRQKSFLEALNSKSIKFDDFISLCRKAEVPYPLFFLEEKYVRRIIADYKKKVFFGVSKKQLSISSRGDFALADISLVLKDITRKQNYIKKYISEANDISCRYKKNDLDIIQKANLLRAFIGYDLNTIIKLNKEQTFAHLDARLASKNVFISLYAHDYTPQYIRKDLQFCGIAINDKKCPFLFIKAGDYDSKIELWGRRLFTAALLLSCLAHGDCRPVTMDGRCRDLIPESHYHFAEEFLMPQSMFEEESCSSIDDMNKLSTKYSVSPSAVVMRLFRLGKISDSIKNEYFDYLEKRWQKRISDKGGRRTIAEKEIVKYNNRAIVKLIFQNYALQTISKQDVRNLLCYKKGEKVNFEALQHV